MKKKTLIYAAICITLLLANIAIYFFYYDTGISRSQFGTFSTEVQQQVPAWTITLTSNQEIDRTAIDEQQDAVFILQPGEEDIIRTSSQQYDVTRNLQFEEIQASVTIREGVSVPEEPFSYYEAPIMHRVYAVLQEHGYMYGEVVPLYHKNQGELRNENRYLFFQNQQRELTNQTVFIEYVHLIGEDVIGGPEVRKLRAASLNSEVIDAIFESLSEQERVQFSVSNESYVSDRDEIYSYFFR